jgi:deoxyribodipyrimidine photo-lyase
MNVLVWFKRDLRVADHPALALAAGMGAVLPVYIVEPDYWALPDTSARQWAFTEDCLTDLRAVLAGLGAPLVVRVGDAGEVLGKLCRAHRISRIISHEETGNLWTFARDRRVRAWARQAGIDWVELPQSGVVRRLTGRDGWAGLRDGFMARAIEDLPALAGVAGAGPGAIPTARMLRLADDRCLHRQAGGRARGLAALDSFLTSRGQPYRAAMSSPLTGERACSRLSPHLALGSLSVREVAQATAARQTERPGGGWGGSLASFQSRLAWRDHFIQKLESQPDIETRCLHRATEGLRPREPDAQRLAAWAKGETGLPFLDACMRYLAATGWLNFRMRSDGDGGCVLSAVAGLAGHRRRFWHGCSPITNRASTGPRCRCSREPPASTSIRIYNPVKQGLDQDPTGVFTRRWVPELAPVPDGFLQEPWKWPGADGLLGQRYPEPLVDVAAAARMARDTVWGLRRTAGFAGEAARVAEAHGSRADRAGRFVNDRTARPKRAKMADAGQLTLDL